MFGLGDARAPLPARQRAMFGLGDVRPRGLGRPLSLQRAAQVRPVCLPLRPARAPARCCCCAARQSSHADLLLSRALETRGFPPRSGQGGLPAQEVPQCMIALSCGRPSDQARDPALPPDAAAAACARASLPAPLPSLPSRCAVMLGRQFPYVVRAHGGSLFLFFRTVAKIVTALKKCLTCIFLALRKNIFFALAR